jgi:hypothetical protein
MQKFSDFSKKVKMEHSELLIQEAKELSIKSEDSEQILESLNVLCDNLILSYITEQEDHSAHISSLLDGEEITINGATVSLSPKEDGLIINGKLIKFFGTAGLEFDIKTAISVMLDDIDDYIAEEFSQSDLDDVIFNMKDNVENLVGYEIKVGTDILTVDWEDPKSGVVSLQLNGKKIEGIDNERAYDYESLKEIILSTLGKLVKTPEEPTQEPKEVSPEAKEKIAVLRTIIRPRLINKFANKTADQNRVYNAIKAYLESGEDEEAIKTELDQRAIIDFCLDMLDIILSNKNLAGLISRDTAATALSESILVEAKKKKKKTSEESVDVKLDMLLKLGLVDAKIYNRAKRALSNKKNAGTVPYLRNLLFDLLDKLISYIKKDTTLYNRIRLNVMKEMKANLNVTLPMKKEIEEAINAGREAAASGKDAEVPESYSKHYFTKEAWLEGYNSFVPEESEVEYQKFIKSVGKEMKTFKEFKQEKSVYNESISLSEIDAITNVVEQLAAVSESAYPTLEEALSEVSEILAQLGVSFNSADAMDNESGTIELPLEDLEGQAMISVFGGESVEDKVEGDLSIKIVTEKSSDGVIIKPEIMVSFEGDEAMSLSDIEFEVDVDDEEEPEEMEGEEEIEEYCDVCDTEYCTCDEMELTEEYIDGQTFNVILFKPATRRFFSVIISAKNEKEIADIVVSDYPQYTINAIYPVKVS